MANHGFPWPSMLDCDKFPLDNDMCITSQSEKKKQKDKKKQLGEKRRSRMKSRREQLREGLRKRFEKGANNN